MRTKTKYIAAQDIRPGHDRIEYRRIDLVCSNNLRGPLTSTVTSVEETASGTMLRLFVATGGVDTHILARPGQLFRLANDEPTTLDDVAPVFPVRGARVRGRSVE